MSRFSKRTNRRYKKVITRRKKNGFTRKYKGKSRRGIKHGSIKYGGAASSTSTSAAKLPMIIDQNQITYTCTPVPTS